MKKKHQAKSAKALFAPQAWGLPEIEIQQLGLLLNDFWERFADCFTTSTRDTSEYELAVLQGLLRMEAERSFTKLAQLPGKRHKTCNISCRTRRGKARKSCVSCAVASPPSPALPSATRSSWTKVPMNVLRNARRGPGGKTTDAWAKSIRALLRAVMPLPQPMHARTTELVMEQLLNRTAAQKSCLKTAGYKHDEP